ncbi:MAG: hypothetical protein IT385_06980 [Deltaproteobacteria bacterium]|nr:hypothetical protein [Deltaproteobacteria bacterium]
MKLALPSLAALVLCACASSSRAPDRSADPALRAALEALLPPEDAEDRAPVALLVADPARAVYAETWSEEGTGIGLAVVIAGGAEDERLEVFTPGAGLETHEAALAEARKNLASRLAGRAVTRLEGEPWPAAPSDDAAPAPSMNAAGGVTLTWSGTTVVASDASGKRLGAIDWADDVEEPHVGKPLIVYGAAGVRTLLVTVLFDPGEGYAEGYNAYGSTYRIDLP